jgi:hypothetical protein
MRYLKTFESVIDNLNKEALMKKQESEDLTVSDILAGYDIYCGNHTNTDESEICGYSFGEREPGPEDKFVKNILTRQCPDCGMEIGNRVVLISDVDEERKENLFGLGRTGIELPGTGFYLFPKSLDSETIENTPKQNGSMKKIGPNTITGFYGLDDSKKPRSKFLDYGSSTEIYKHIEKYINVLVDAYLAITTQKYRKTFTKDVIRGGLVRLQQECKFNDLKRTEAAIKVFGDLMAPMMLDVSKTKNIETWKLGSNGKKYGDVFQDFFNMTRLGGISSEGYPFFNFNH